MIVYACEPKGPELDKYPLYYRAFCAWLFRAHPELFISQKPEFGPRRYHQYGELLQLVFPKYEVPDPRTIKDWAAGKVDWVQRVTDLGALHPSQFYKEWCHSHPEEVKELARFLGMPGGLKAQEYVGRHYGTEELTYVPQVQTYACVSSQAPITQAFQVMCQVLVVGMVAWFAGQCVKVAKS